MSPRVSLESEQDGKTRPPARRRRRRRGPAVLALLIVSAAAAVALAPQIVARVAALRHRAVTWVLPPVDGRITVQAAALGWNRPVVLTGLEVRDASGKPVATADRVTCAKTLAALVLAPGAPGDVRLERPRVQAVLRDKGSNLEDLLAPALRRRGGRVPALRLTTEDAELSVQADGTEAVTLKPLSMTLQTGAAEKPLELDLQIADGADEGAGRLKLQVTLNASANEPATARLTAERYHVEALGPLLARWGIPARSAGRMEGDVRLSGDLAKPAEGFELRGKIRFDEPRLSLGILHPDESLTPEAVELEGLVTCRDGTCEIERVDLRSDLAVARVAGRFTLDAATDSSAADRWQRFADDARLAVTAEFDLPRLAQMIPRTLRLRSDARITAGRIRGELRLGGPAGGGTCRALVAFRDFDARVGDRRVELTDPMELAATARWKDQAPQIEELRLTAPHLTLSGKGNAAEGTAEWTGDLAGLTSELGQVLDLEGLRLAGDLQGRMQWSLPPEGAMRVTLRALARNLEVLAPAREPWREAQLELVAELQGQNSEDTWRVDTAVGQLTSGEDRLDIRLREPVAGPLAAATWPVDLHLAGKLETWHRRVPRALLPGVARAAGAVVARAGVQVTEQSVVFDSFRGDVENLSLVTSALQISDPLVRLEGSGTWSRDGRQLTLPDVTLTSRTIAARVRDLAMRGGENGLGEAHGLLGMQVDLGRLAGWFGPGQSAIAALPAGIAQARLRLSRDGARVEVEGEVHSVESSPDTNPPAARPGPVKLALRATWDTEHDRLDLTTCDVQAADLRATVRGHVDAIRTRRVAQLTGTFAYDLEPWQPLVQQWAGAGVQIRGSGRRDFSLSGPLTMPRQPLPARAVSQIRSERPEPATPRVPEELMARTSFGWSQVSAAGITFGPGELQLALDRGVLDGGALDLAAGEGTLHLAPRLLLNHEPVLLVLDKGPAAKKVVLTPEMCAGWMRYIAPLLADATEADAQFSLDLADCRVPLLQPRAGRIEGTLAIHAGEVRPGGIARQLVAIGRQVEALLQRRAPRGDPNNLAAVVELPEQQVAFRMADGRVEHARFVMHVGDVEIRTTGSVGFDESLQLVATVPILDEWVARDRVLRGLRGQAIQIPIRGTLDRPEIDPRALSQLAQRLAGSAAESAIEDLLQQQLDRLLPRGK